MPARELLDAGVRRRLEALRQPADRERHATGAALSDALARIHGGPAARVVRRRGEAPAVEGAVRPPEGGAAAADGDGTVRPPREAPPVDRAVRPPVGGASDLHLSVAHGGAWVVVAITALAPVGVDVEAITRELDVDGLAAQVLAPAERDVLRALEDADARRRALLTWWTRKEAVLKATGDGLRIDPRDVVLSPPGAAPRLVAFAGRPELVGPCAIADLAPDDAHVGAVAVLAPEPVTLTRADGAVLLGLS
jgi:4'-phosphopantetheinyl transferase